MRRAAMFGGSFNPVHNAHTQLVCEMISALGLDTVYVVPTYITPLKDNTGMATASQRLDMCRLAFSDISRAEVCDVEIQRGGSSYTVDTLKVIRQAESDAKLYLLLGTDSFLSLNKWKSTEEIVSLADIAVALRPGFDTVRITAAVDKYKAQGAAVTLVEGAQIDLSSTDIRKCIGNGWDFSAFVNSRVHDYIIENGLYGYGN